MRPAVTMCYFGYATDPSLNMCILSAWNVPNCVANHVLARRGTCKPLLIGQITGYAMEYGVYTGELLLNICDCVHGFLTLFSIQLNGLMFSRPTLKLTGGP